MTKGRRKPDIRPKTATTKTSVDKQTGERLVPIVRVLPEDVYQTFCDGLVIQNTGDVFILSFLQTRHPLAVTEEEKAEIKALEQECVARIVMTPSQLAKTLLAMDNNFSKFLVKIGEDVKDFKEFIEKYRNKDEEILEIG